MLSIEGGLSPQNFLFLSVFLFILWFSFSLTFLSFILTTFFLLSVCSISLAFFVFCPPGFCLRDAWYLVSMATEYRVIRKDADLNTGTVSLNHVCVCVCFELGLCWWCITYLTFYKMLFLHIGKCVSASLEAYVAFFSACGVCVCVCGCGVLDLSFKAACCFLFPVPMITTFTPTSEHCWNGCHFSHTLLVFRWVEMV